MNCVKCGSPLLRFKNATSWAKTYLTLYMAPISYGAKYSKSSPFGRKTFATN